MRYHRSRFFTLLFFMPKILENNSCKNKKSCRVFLQESNKIGIAFFWFFYEFLRNLQESAKHMYYLRFTFATRPLIVLIPHEDIFGSHKTPREEGGRRNWVPGPWGRRFRPKSGELAGVPSRGRRGSSWGAHRGSIWVLGWDRGCAGEGVQRRQCCRKRSCSPCTQRVNATRQTSV
jgi:hypothetical protein